MFVGKWVCVQSPIMFGQLIHKRLNGFTKSIEIFLNFLALQSVESFGPIDYYRLEINGLARL